MDSPKAFQLTGDGNFHVLLMVRADVLEDVHEAHRLAGDIATAAISTASDLTDAAKKIVAAIKAA